jgi:hypothetical protein
MGAYWKFVRQKRNREVLGWLGGGLVVAVTGLWAAIIYLFPPQKPSELRPANIQANCGGVAIGGSVTGATINGAAVNSDCSSTAERGAAP